MTEWYGEEAREYYREVLNRMKEKFEKGEFRGYIMIYDLDEELVHDFWKDIDMCSIAAALNVRMRYFRRLCGSDIWDKEII